LRGRLMQQMAPGAMLAVPLSESMITPWLMNGISLAAVNIAGQCVLSGPEEPIVKAAAALAKQGVEGVRLRTSHAFHSSMMDPVLADFSSALRGLNLRPPAIPFISNVTGDWISSSQAIDPDYWTRHLRETVRFADGLERLLRRPEAILLEIGPGRTLAGLARQHPQYSPSTPLVNVLRGSKEEREDFDILLHAVGRLWSEGVSFDWKAFYSRERRLRLPLPTYPFERKRYWIEPAEPKGRPAVLARIPGKLPEITDWLYLPSWKRVERTYAGEMVAAKKWLVFSEGELGDALVERIRELGGTVATAMRGPKWDQAAYDSLVAGDSPDVVMHCWLADSRGRSFDEWQEAGFHSILGLVRALAGRRVTINVVSMGLHAVTGAERLEPAKSTVLGSCRVVPQEHPGMRCRNIDIDSGVPASIVDVILSEVMTPVSEPVVAYRHGRRWVQCFEPANFQQQSTGNSLLRPRGVYLITGGFGNVGVTLAETLARNFQARLALVGRNAPPPETNWRALPPKTTSIRAVQELRELGAEVLPIRADAADPAQMEAAIEEALQHFGQLNGVIHAAGAMNAEAFRSASATDARAADLHFRNKAKSALVLRDAIARHSLDFCMMISSLASILGGLEFSAYAAANIFLDSLADQQNQNADSPRWVSVNWDGWHFDEAKPAAHEFFLTPAEGAAVFRTILSRPNPRQVIVSTGDLETRLDRWIRFTSPVSPVEPQTPGLTAVHPRPEVETKYAAPRNSVEQMIADVWQLVLGVNSIGIEDDFFELGGHSLLAIQLVSRLRDLFQVEIALTAIFEHSTIAQLAEHVQSIAGNAEAQMERLAKMLDYVEQLSPEEVEALLADEAKS
jgi:acyl transferase domain-containing protein/acyl carrier protein